MARKTVEVKIVKDKINGMLACPLEHMSRDAKMSLCCLVEDILMDSGNYHGFGFADPSARPGDDLYYNRTYY